MPSYVPIVMYSLRLFIVFLTLFTKLFGLRNVYYNVYHDYCGVFIEKYVYTMFWSLELRGHLVPIVMYGLRLFIIVLQELHCLLNCLHICMIREKGGYHFTEFLCSTPSGF